LYDFVYTSRFSVLAVFFIFISFLIQPFHQAIAAEDINLEPESQTVSAEAVREQVDAPAEDLPVEIAEDTTSPAPQAEEENSVDSLGEAGNEDTSSSSETEDVVGDTQDTAQTEDQSSTESDNDTATTTSNLASSSTSANEQHTSQEFDDTTENTMIQNDGTSATTSTSTSTTTNSANNSSGSSNQESEQSGTSGGSQTTPDTTGTQDEPTSEESEQNNSSDGSTQDETDESTDEIENNNDSSTSTLAERETPVVQAEILINEDNFYQFSKQSCVAVGDGTYHCSSNVVDEYDTQSVIYSDLGENGNLEIFLQTSDGEVRQITDNQYDDSSPYYDAETLQIVWQRLIDGRYQVILYDIIEEEESQLTFSRTNNMEPKVSRDGVVWQAWDNNDWEIMYFDGTFTDQITDNNTQDVAPVIQDRYILWTVIGRGDQEGKVYSLDSNELLTISGYDGGVIENPRFVLVYDTKFENGDIITKGFDPATGISEPIAAKPAPEPVNIPKTDPTGEIRALIQNKSSLEDELAKQLVHSDDTGAGTTTASTSDTLNLKDDTTETVPISATSTDGVFELTEFDLILSDTDINFDELEEIEEILDSEEPLEIEESSTQE
jgi:hypothetical protein